MEGGRIRSIGSMSVGAGVGGATSGHNSSDSTRGGGGGVGGRSGPCGACKFLRRKCVNECIFGPYFDSEQGVPNFAAVHKVFGASNASKLLLGISPLMRQDSVFSMIYEAQARLHDPVYGCTSRILALQQQVMNLKSELLTMQTSLANMTTPTQPTFVTQPQTLMIDTFPAYNLSSSSSNLQTQVQWAPQQQEAQQQQLHQQQFVHGGDNGITNDSDMQEVAWDLLDEWVAGDGLPPPHI